jgi:hypothetical protein
MTSAVSGFSAALYKDEQNRYRVTPALGSNRDICFACKVTSCPSIQIVVAGSNTSLSVSVIDDDVIVYSATNVGGTATSTALQIVDAVNADAGASALIEARIPPGQTGAGVTGALDAGDVATGVAFVNLALVDSGDHLTFQAAAGSRYWDDDLSVTIEDGGVEVTSGFTVNHLRGSVTFESSMSGHAITATGTRRSELAFEKILLVYDGKLKIDGREIDTTSIDDDGWGNSISGRRSWDISASAFYYTGESDLPDVSDTLYWKIYAIKHTKSFVGMGTLLSLDRIVANPDKAQERAITIKGNGEIYPET